MICSIYFILFYSFLTCAVISFEGGVKRYNFLFKEYITRLDQAGSRSLGFSKPGSHAAKPWVFFFAPIWQSWMWHVRRQESAILWSMCLTWTYVWHQHWASFSCQHGASFSWKNSIVFHHTPGRAALFLPYTSKRLLTRCHLDPKNLPKTPNLSSYLDIWMSRVGKPLYFWTNWSSPCL